MKKERPLPITFSITFKDCGEAPPGIKHTDLESALKPSTEMTIHGVHCRILESKINIGPPFSIDLKVEELP